MTPTTTPTPSPSLVKTSLLGIFCIFSVTWLAGDVKEPTHLSKREGHVVPGVVVYLSFHAWLGWVSETKYGLIAAASGTFTS